MPDCAILRRIALYVCICLTLSNPCHLSGQASATGSIVAPVTDSAGAVIPQAEVTIINEATGVRSSAVTNSVGRYDFTALPAGLYTLRVSQKGFSNTEVPHINLKVGGPHAADVTLQ